ncbi:CLUMA_CG000844, isoform A [Clunio marinus]|uniref:CLUMA_CG000844, isoform A n=1 Tax=Clunio marinus TaxID=568069 RepID=A0A1J1HHZ6_9DIPT|nr:CLUMA_CG000844, isoform A [Clunio marinus]
MAKSFYFGIFVIICVLTTVNHVIAGGGQQFSCADFEISPVACDGMCTPPLEVTDFGGGVCCCAAF